MRRFALPLIALGVAGCSVGPDYGGPVPLPPAASPHRAFVRAPATTSPQQPSLAPWWTILVDPVLNTLEANAIAENPGISAARARIAQARQALRFERAERFPSGGAQATYIHADVPGLNLADRTPPGAGMATEANSDASSLSVFNLGFNASWEIDIWGSRRRTVEAARAQLGSTIANAADAQLQLTAEVARTYVSLRESQHRIASLRRTTALQQQLLGLAQRRFSQGTTAAFEVEGARTQLSATSSELARGEADREAALNALAALTGATPGTVDGLLGPVAPIPLPPSVVPIADPAALMRRRPDVRAAERGLAAATARIGVIEAARLPKVSFMGILGIGGTSPSQVFDLGSMSTIAIPQIQWGLLDFGRSLARLRQSRDARDEAEARYREAVLGAFQDVETSLSRFGQQRRTVAAQAEIVASSERASALTRQRYDAGTVSLSESLQTARQSEEARRNLFAATAALTASFIAVEKSLGLGWQAETATDGSGRKTSSP